jgi:Putative cyclase
MKRMLGVLGIVVMLILAVSSRDVWTQVAKDMAAKSPWGPDDEIGTLNMMTDDSRFDILKRIGTGKVYDLSVDLYVGMPGCCASFGDPSYQIWMTHTPKRATAKTSPPESGELASYSGDAISMYTHTGTHIDTLNHFSLHGKIWNQVSADEALGARGWVRSGADKYPPIITRGVLIDVAKSKNLALLPESYAITGTDLQEPLKKQGSTLKPGDVVFDSDRVHDPMARPCQISSRQPSRPEPRSGPMAGGETTSHAARGG